MTVARTMLFRAGRPHDVFDEKGHGEESGGKCPSPGNTGDREDGRLLYVI